MKIHEWITIERRKEIEKQYLQFNKDIKEEWCPEILEKNTYKNCELVKEILYCNEFKLPNKNYCEFHFKYKYCKHKKYKEDNFEVKFWDDEFGIQKIRNCISWGVWWKEFKTLNFDNFKKYFLSLEDVNIEENIIRFNKLYDFLTEEDNNEYNRIN